MPSLASRTEAQRGLRTWFTPSVWAWCTVAALLIGPALLVARAGGPASDLLAWQPELGLSQPWRAWSAAWVHLSPLHLWGCIAAAVLTALLGVAVPAAPRSALAWALAWPLTQFTLLMQPELPRYAGMSGVVHGGVAIMIVQLLRMPSGWHRALGATLAVGIVTKLLLETPWAGPLLHAPEWDIAVAPMSHVAGTVWGAVLGVLVLRRVRG